MNFALCILLLVSVQYTASESNISEQCKASSVGMNFVFGIIGYAARGPSYTFYLHITPVMQVPAHVRVTAPFVNMDKTYTVSNYTIVPLNGSLIQFENGTQFKGIEVSSDVNISVTVITAYGDLTEGFLALPVSALGTRYIAASYSPYSSYNSEILVTGVESDTDVTLNTVTNSRMSSNRTLRLQKFETYQFKANNDVSGSIVTSNKPVAVSAGSADSRIPVGIGDYQYIVEQMIPTKYWTTMFISPPIYPRRHFVLKFFADQDSTEVHYYNSTNHFSVFMNKGSTVELLFGTDPVVILANKPISVIQYGHDGDNMYGDPFMSISQGILQFQDSYRFVTQKHYRSRSNTIAITIPKNSTSGLLLNGQSMSYWNSKNVSVASPMDQYITLFVNVSYNSYYHLYHSGVIHFGAVIYGRYFNAAYGYPLQLSFTNTYCEKHETGSTVTPASPQTTAVTTYSNTTIEEGNAGLLAFRRLNSRKRHTGTGTWCFQCDGMTHLQYCDQVQRCQTKGEVCYVQTYPKSLSVNLYRSGCISPEKCNNNNNGNDGCTECCHGNFCNTAGCGDKGLPAPGQRGPVCFDCTYKREDEACNTVKLCHSNQACMVARYEWGDNDFYHVMGCTDAQVCSTKRSPAEPTKRNVPVCTHCCHSDFCNMNCTSGDTIPSIVARESSYTPGCKMNFSSTGENIGQPCLACKKMIFLL